MLRGDYKREKVVYSTIDLLQRKLELRSSSQLRPGLSQTPFLSKIVGDNGVCSRTNFGKPFFVESEGGAQTITKTIGRASAEQKREISIHSLLSIVYKKRLKSTENNRELLV